MSVVVSENTSAITFSLDPSLSFSIKSMLRRKYALKVHLNGVVSGEWCGVVWCGVVDQSAM